MKLTYERYALKSIFFHFYMVFLYLIPFAIFGKHQKFFIIFLLFCFGISFLSTFWNVKILLFQCFIKKAKGRFILFDKVVCEIKEESIDVDEIKNSKSNQQEEINSKGKNIIETFICNRHKYFIEKNEIKIVQPCLNYTLKQLHQGITVPNYNLFPLNEYNIPKPNFYSLFKEQCVTPLFCFQIFSSLLMCFDDHVKNCLFSTAMIIFVEGSMVFSRVATMKIFRKLEHSSFKITRLSQGDLRNNKKEEVSTLQLKPGDKVLIDSVVDIPCDLIILNGSCAVNEAMLSGESVPIFKDEISAEDTILSFTQHKNNILFAGTKIEKLYSPMTCIVLRTGFDTEQGLLISKMLKSEDIKYDPEAFKFIILLVFISLINGYLTYKYSSKQGYALFLDLIILFTNSIPFELPMEMGMSVQSAVKNLMKMKIYCLEPFRITLAGKVDVCCFDKTGTLTDSKIEVKNIEHTNEFTNKVLSCCHNLIMVDNEVKGDPLELAIYNYPFEKSAFKQIKNFSFTSELKRQAVVADFDNQLCFAMKGAPEVIEEFLFKVPKEYSEYKEYARQGYRVIALAYKKLNKNDLKISEDRLSDRSYLERDMIFCGFILLGSTLKKYAREMCEILQNANIKVLMITGDSILTGMNVAQQLKINGKGVEGSDIDNILNSPNFLEYSIFGRANPKHKELIIKKYQSYGNHTMMVGDGTNDVGALKAADVGVAILEEQEILKPKTKKPITALERIRAEQAELESIRPGDASIAAPFTVKSDSLESIIEIIQQGRSSLVTTIQMYKIIALNSITGAFFTMAVDILGIKFSDYQMVSLGMLSSIGFMAITQPQSLRYISKERPSNSIFNLYVLSSLIAQSIIQTAAVYLVYKAIPFKISSESKFTPSMMNTALFVISAAQSISNFICNYIGRPFREDIHENRILSLSILGMIAFIANVLFKVHQEINDFIEVVDISDYRYLLLGLSIMMILLSLLTEKIFFRIFMIK